MKFPMPTFVLTGLLVLAAPAMAHDPKAHAPAAPSQAASDQARPAVAVVEQFSAALQAGNLDRVRTLLAEDVLILESGGAERSREEYLGHHAISDAAFLKGAHVQVKQRTARAEGPLAWVGTESELHATKNGKPVTLLSTETVVLRKTGADWRIVHIHWSSRPKKTVDATTAPAPSAQPGK